MYRCRQHLLHFSAIALTRGIGFLLLRVVLKLLLLRLLNHLFLLYHLFLIPFLFFLLFFLFLLALLASLPTASVAIFKVTRHRQRIFAYFRSSTSSLRPRRQSIGLLITFLFAIMIMMITVISRRRQQPVGNEPIFRFLLSFLRSHVDPLVMIFILFLLCLFLIVLLVALPQHGLSYSAPAP